MRELIIDGRRIADDSDCYTIAEIGNNHGGSLERCKELIRVAKECGADAVKLQKRDNETLYTNAMLNRPYDNPNSFGATYGEHRRALELSISDFEKLKEYSEEIGLTFFSTAFDIPSANQLQEIGVPAYKLASGDLKSIPLLHHIAKFGKPMIISTGGATQEDVKRAVNAILPINKQLAVLQCTAGYPPEFNELNLNVIKTFRDLFPDLVIGLSSHDNGIMIPVVAYMLGARIVEKHFTLNHTWKGTDNAFSLEPAGFAKMVRDLKRVKISLGDGVKKPYPCEATPLEKMAKSLVATSDLPRGHRISDKDVLMKTPGSGLPPYFWDQVVGKTLKMAKSADDFFKLEDFE
jgi:N-acetylneuraminate synthase/sialic acid synthase